MSQVLQRANDLVDSAIGQVEVTIEVNKKPYKGFKSVRVESAMDEFGRYAEATLTYESFATFPIKLNSLFSVKFRNASQKRDEYVFTGYIESVEAVDNADGSEIRISGRDKLADIQDSSLVVPITFKSPARLRDIIFKALDRNGFTVQNILSKNAALSLDGNYIGIIDLVNPSEFGDDDVISSDVGQNIFEFLNIYASKRQCILTSDEYGNIVITRGNGNNYTYKTGIIRRITSLPSNTLNAITGAVLPSNTRENNVLNSAISFDNSQRFSKYVFISQKNAGQLAFNEGDIDVANMANIQGMATDTEIRSQRQLVQSMDGAKDVATLRQRAIWEANIRRIRALNYTVSIQGFIAKNDNEIWRTNRIVVVNDEKNSMDSNMLIKRIVYSFSDGGSIVTMDLTYPDAFQLQTNITASEAKTNKVGLDIF